MMTQPASRTRADGGASAGLGVMSPTAVPTGVAKPLTAMLSLIVIGTPSSGLRGAPARHRASDACACASAPSASTVYMALIFGSHAGMRASAACVTSTGESSFALYADESAWAVRLWIAVIDTPRLRLLWAIVYSNWTLHNPWKTGIFPGRSLTYRRSTMPPLQFGEGSPLCCWAISGTPALGVVAGLVFDRLPTISHHF